MLLLLYAKNLQKSTDKIKANRKIKKENKNAKEYFNKYIKSCCRFISFDS